MTTPLVIVDGKSASGRRLSVSIDAALWGLYMASRGFCPQKARRDLRHCMQNDVIANTYDARKWIYYQIVNPALVTKELNPTLEAEFDTAE